jgi:hypothetical protein
MLRGGKRVAAFIAGDAENCVPRERIGVAGIKLKKPFRPKTVNITPSK